MYVYHNLVLPDTPRQRETLNFRGAMLPDIILSEKKTH